MDNDYLLANRLRRIYEKNASQLEREEIRKLFELLASGDKSVENILLNKYLMLVVAKAVKASITNKSVLTQDDLIQAGLLGLLRAIRTFDYRQGCDFLLYAFL